MIRGRDLSGHVLDGRYQIVERLAEGAMGVVYRGIRTQLNRAVAIKVMHSALPAAMAGRERFEREAKLMALLEHPHCVSVIDYGLYDNKPYVVMELVRGRSLLDLIAEQNRFDVPRACEIICQALSGLSHAHEHGIIHRDIKPANIMVTPKAPLGIHVRILDFGLARVREANTSLSDGVVVGTPSYMAPEQCRGDKLDTRVDLYACGVVLFELLAGRKPFVADDPIAIVKLQLERSPPRLADIAGGDFGKLEAVVARALAKQPAERFPTAIAMSEAIDAAIGGRTVRGDGDATSAIPESLIASRDVIPVESSVDVPITVGSSIIEPVRAGSSVRKLLPRSRMRYAVLPALALVAAGIYALVIYAQREQASDADSRDRAVFVTEPPVGDAAPDTVATAIATANDLLAAGKIDAALDVVAVARKQMRADARLPFTAGKIYFAKLWWVDGIANLREAIHLDPSYRLDPELIKLALRAFITTPQYDARLGAFIAELGSAAVPYLEETVRNHPNPDIRARASSQLHRQ